MPELVKLLIRHALIGFALAILLVLALVTFRVGTLHELLTSPDGRVGLIILTLYTGLTFASAQMGIGVMLAGRKDDGDDHPGTMLTAVVVRIRQFVRESSTGKTQRNSTR